MREVNGKYGSNPSYHTTAGFLYQGSTVCAREMGKTLMPNTDYPSVNTSIIANARIGNPVNGVPSKSNDLRVQVPPTVAVVAKLS